jgi:hypothetical protein
MSVSRERLRAPWWPEFPIGMAVIIALAIIFDPTRVGLTEAELAAAPLSGSLFAIRTDTVGLAEPKFPG